MDKFLKMRVKIFLLITVILVICTAQIVFAEDELTTEKTIVRVGYDSGYGVINNINSLDDKGFGYDILIRAEHYSNYEFEFHEYDYYGALEALEKGEIDLMGIMFSDTMYQDAFSYVEKSVGSAQLILATKDGNTYYDDPMEIDGKTVASFQDNLYERYLDAYCEENEISVNYIRGEQDTYTNLDTDFYLVTTIDQNIKDFNMVMNFKLFDLHFITHKDNPQLAQSISDAIELSVSADGTFLEELQIKYYGEKQLTRRFLTRDEVTLLASKPLTCGYIDHHQPIQYTNDEGLPDGISVQLMTILSETYGFDVTYVPYNHSMTNESHENLDILLSATGDYEHEMEFYTPSESFLELPMMLLSKSNRIEELVSENHSSKMGMLNYITIDHADILERYPSNTIVSYGTFDDMLEGYINGEIDGILATDHGIEYAQTVLGTEQYVIRSTGLALPLRIFISRDIENLTGYIGAFNVMFEHLSQNEIDEVITYQSASYTPEYSARDFIMDNLLIILTGLFIIFFIVALIVFYLQNKKKSDILKIINYDSVTDLISTYYFNEKVNEILPAAKPNEYEVIDIDIDSFHTINKLYSKEIGNQVICAVASALSESYKGTNALIARVIADQFVIFHKKNEGMPIKEICENNISSSIKVIMGEEYNISMSIGTCLIKNTSQRIDEIIDCAVAARLKGKQKYHFTYYEYDDEIKKEHEMKTSIVYRMKEALSSNQFKVVFQPKIDLNTLKINGAEALVRWHTSGKYGVIPPDSFISIFESNGFIVDLDLYVFDKVCAFIKSYSHLLNVPLISVNVSTITLFDNRFPAEYSNILSKYDLPASKVEIEITESATALEQRTLIKKLQELEDLGFFISIDDFGAGESSLNRLSSITAHTIKLDKAFLDYSIVNEKGSIVVGNVIKLAKQLNMNVLCEGVETAAQAEWLKDLDCDYAQGYYFAKPLSKQQFINLLSADKTYDIKS